MTYTASESAAWTSGRVAGIRLSGIGSNPHPASTGESDAWEAGYKAGRDEREGRDEKPAGAIRLRNVAANTYTADKRKFFVLCDAGNGSSCGEDGRTLEYDEQSENQYGDILLRPTQPTWSADGTMTIFASDWLDGIDGYRFQIRF